MTFDIGTVICGPSRSSWPDSIPPENLFLLDNSDNDKTPCRCYQDILEMSNADVIIYIHSDVTIHDADWIERVMKPFEREECVAVGFGGATSLGRPDLYRKPYNIWNMARGGYASNQTDAEVHGERFTGERRVAVLDAFLMAVRRDWLRGRKTYGRTHRGIDWGWPVDHLTFHCLDLWLGCEAARDDKEIWMAGVDCTHHGGGTSITKKYAGSPWLQGGTLSEDHQKPHFWLADHFRDVLPFGR